MVLVYFILLVLAINIVDSQVPTLHWINVDYCRFTCAYSGHITGVSGDFELDLYHNSTGLNTTFGMTTTRAFHRHTMVHLYDYTEPQVLPGPCQTGDLCIFGNKIVKPGLIYSVYNVTSATRHHVMDLTVGGRKVSTIDLPEGGSSGDDIFVMESHSVMTIDPVREIGTLIVVPKTAQGFDPQPMVCPTNIGTVLDKTKVGLVKVDAYGNLETNITILESAYTSNMGAVVTYSGLHLYDYEPPSRTWIGQSGRFIHSDGYNGPVSPTGYIATAPSPGLILLNNTSNDVRTVTLYNYFDSKVRLIELPALSVVRFEFESDELWCLTKWTSCMKYNDAQSSWQNGDANIPINYFPVLNVMTPIDLTMQPRTVEITITGRYATSMTSAPLYVDVNFYGKTFDGNAYIKTWSNVLVSSTYSATGTAFTTTVSSAIAATSNKFSNIFVSADWNITDPTLVTFAPETGFLSVNSTKASINLSNQSGTYDMCMNFNTGYLLSSHRMLHYKLSLSYANLTTLPSVFVRYVKNNSTINHVLWTDDTPLVGISFDFNLDFIDVARAELCFRAIANTTTENVIFAFSELSYYWLGVDSPLMDDEAYVTVQFSVKPLTTVLWRNVEVTDVTMALRPFTTYGGSLDYITARSNCDTISMRIANSFTDLSLFGDDDLVHTDYISSNKRSFQNVVDDVGTKKMTISFSGLTVPNQSTFTSCAEHVSDSIVILGDIITVTSTFVEKCNASVVSVALHTAPDGAAIFGAAKLAYTNYTQLFDVQFTTILVLKTDFTLVGVLDYGVGTPMIWQTRVYRNVTDPCRWFCDVPIVSESSTWMKVLFALGLGGLVVAGLSVCSGPLVSVGVACLAAVYYGAAILGYIWKGIWWFSMKFKDFAVACMRWIVNKWRKDWNDVNKAKPKPKEKKKKEAVPKVKKDAKQKQVVTSDLERGQVKTGGGSDSGVMKYTFTVVCCLGLLVPVQGACVNSVLSTSNVTLCSAGNCGVQLSSVGTIPMVKDSEFCATYSNVQTNLGSQIVPDFGVKIKVIDFIVTYPLVFQYYSGPINIVNKTTCECPTGRSHYCDTSTHPQVLDCITADCTYISDQTGPSAGCNLIGSGHYCATIQPLMTIDYPIYRISHDPTCELDLLVTVDGSTPQQIPVVWDCVTDKDVSFGVKSILSIKGVLSNFDYSLTTEFLVRSRTTGWLLQDMNPVGQFDTSRPGWLQKAVSGSLTSNYDKYALANSFRLTGVDCVHTKANIAGEYADIGNYLTTSNGVSQQTQDKGVPILTGFDSDTVFQLRPFTGPDFLFSLVTDSSVVKFAIDNSCPKILSVNQTTIYENGLTGNLLVNITSTCGSGAAVVTAYNPSGSVIGSCGVVLTSVVRTCVIPYTTLEEDPVVEIIAQSYFNTAGVNYTVQTTTVSAFNGDSTFNNGVQETQSCWYCLPNGSDFKLPWTSSWYYGILKILAIVVLIVIAIVVSWKLFVRCLPKKSTLKIQ